MYLGSKLEELKGVGAQVSGKFAGLGLHTIADLLNYYPRRYDDFSDHQKIAELKPGSVTIVGKFAQVTGKYVRRGMHITEAIVSDGSGSVRITWFNQPYRANQIQIGKDYFVSGHFELKRQRFSIMNPSIELVSDFQVNTARIIPIYRESNGVSSRQIRLLLKQIRNLFISIQETLPNEIVEDHGLMSRGEALKNIHLPDTKDLLEAARHRLGFEEVLELSVASLLNKQLIQSENALIIDFNEKLAKNFVKHLPFDLTNDQRKVVWQIYLDLQKPQPMNRMVEGDVGSGKTVVATMAALMVMAQKKQAAFMAPTELLARQHADTIYKLLAPLKQQDTVGLITGSMTSKEKDKVRASLADGTIQFIIGTHALIQDSIDMHDLALVIVDEQHRFGVEQRKSLMRKAGQMPHILSLTATPIPRSLALTLYGELDISIIEEKPAGRKPILTELISPNSRNEAIVAIEKELKSGRQMFVVCPLISDSALVDAQSAEKVFEQLQTKDFKKWHVGLLHGKMKPNDKSAVMQDFIDHKLDILVSTTVIEVGVDVPNASIMMIETPERFGLAQIHQLRGRVGRNSMQGYCYLMLSDSKTPSQRLQALEQSNDGFKLAELDLRLRGPGAIYGISQHGALDLRIAQLTDVKLIAEARQTAEAFVRQPADLLQYKEFMSHVNHLRAVTNLN
jgi:ATP-dependent DNA helicase RecG